MKTYLCFKEAQMYGGKDEVEFVTHSLEKAREYSARPQVRNEYESYKHSYKEVPLK